MEDEWKEYPDLTAWPDKTEGVPFNWSLSLSDVKKKYKSIDPKNRDGFDTGWGTSFNMMVRNYLREKDEKLPIKKSVKATNNVVKFYSTEQYNEIKKWESHPGYKKFDIEPTKNNLDAPSVNFHYEDEE